MNSYYRSAVDHLAAVASSEFGLEVRTVLPITDSFSSAVLSFIATDDRHYIVKQPWAPNKAIREADALRALEHHPDVPALLQIVETAGVTYLLIEGLRGSPWSDVRRSTPRMLRRLGRAVRLVHRTPAESFDGRLDWHGLLAFNAERYRSVIGHPDIALAASAHALLDRHVPETPQSETPCLVHFDLRPGNILVDDGELTGLIDFEACRGGHGSMDFFKLWQQVAPVVPNGLREILVGYLDDGHEPEAWANEKELDRLMQIYSAYHGLAGLSWCHTRQDFDGDFPDTNRSLIESSIEALG